MAETMPQPYTSPQDFTVLGERVSKIDLKTIIAEKMAAQDSDELARIEQKFGPREGKYDYQAEQRTVQIFNEGGIFESVALAPRTTDVRDHVDFFVQLHNGTIIAIDYTETADPNEYNEKVQMVLQKNGKPLETIPELGIIPRLVISSEKGALNQPQENLSSSDISAGKRPLPNPHKLVQGWFDQIEKQLTWLEKNRPEYRQLYIGTRRGLKFGRHAYFERVRKQAA